MNKYIKKAKINILYAFISYIILSLMTFLIRRVFLESLSLEYLGYEGLFGDLFSLIALADLGVETIILYRLFAYFSNKEFNEISYLMNIYRYIYRYVGFAVFIIGVAVLPFLKYLVDDNDLNWNYVYIVYIIQLFSTILVYFLSYNRIVFVVNQREYECTLIDAAVSLVFNAIKIVALLKFHSYVLYLICSLLVVLFSNIIISFKCKKEFDYINYSNKISLLDVRRLHLGNDIKNNIIQKICGTIYGGTDYILVSAFFGFEGVGLLANYMLIQSFLTGFLTRVLKPFQGAIGNSIYSDDQSEKYELYRMYDYISFIIACVVSICYLNVFNPFIEIWIGHEYLLSFWFVLAFSINQYIMWNHYFMTFYRYSFGNYEIDRLPIILATVLNVLLSFILLSKIGIAGAMIGTAIGHLGFWIGRVKVVYSLYISEKIELYFFRQIYRSIIFTLEMYISYYFCSFLPTTILGVMIRVFVCLMISISMCSLLCCFSPGFKKLMNIFVNYRKR